MTRGIKGGRERGAGEREGARERARNDACPMHTSPGLGINTPQKGACGAGPQAGDATSHVRWQGGVARHGEGGVTSHGQGDVAAQGGARDRTREGADRVSLRPSLTMFAGIPPHSLTIHFLRSWCAYLTTSGYIFDHVGVHRAPGSAEAHDMASLRPSLTILSRGRDRGDVIGHPISRGIHLRAGCGP